MLRRWQVIGITVLLLALSGAVTVSPSAARHGTRPMGGTAHAAQTGNPLKTWEELLAALRGARDLEPGEWRLPRVWKPQAAKYTTPWTRWLKRVRAADLGKRLENESWTCDAADYLDRFDKINEITKTLTVQHVTDNNMLLVTEQQVRGFVEQAAQLGKSTVVQLVNAACTS
jgi:hypothetical protein